LISKAGKPYFVQLDGNVLVPLQFTSVAWVKERRRHARGSIDVTASAALRVARYSTEVKVVASGSWSGRTGSGTGRTGSRRGSRRRNENVVNDVDHAVACGIVRRCHCSVLVDNHPASFYDLDVFTLEGLHHLKTLEILREHSSASDDVVFEDGLKLLDVRGIEEMGKGARRHILKGFIGGGEDGERTSAGEGVSELASHESGNEGGKIGDRLRELDDVLRRAGAGCSGLR